MLLYEAEATELEAFRFRQHAKEEERKAPIRSALGPVFERLGNRLGIRYSSDDPAVREQELVDQVTNDLQIREDLLASRNLEIVALRQALASGNGRLPRMKQLTGNAGVKREHSSRTVADHQPELEP